MVPGQWVIVRRPVLSVLGKMVQSGWGKKIWPLKGCQGRQWCPQRCPWCAGSRLQVASWAQPSALPQEAACLWERLREYAVPYITAKACLKHENNIPLISSHPPIEESTHSEIWLHEKRNSATDIWVGGSFVYVRACVGAGHAFNMHQLSLVSDHHPCGVWHEQDKKECGGGSEGGDR